MFHRSRFSLMDGTDVRCSWFQIGSRIIGYRETRSGR